jgi:outer membrane protein assembly factor BamB
MTTRFRSLAVASIILTCAGCGTASAIHPAAHPAVRGAVPSCPAPPPRHGWAAEVSDTGRVIWQTSLPTHGNDVSSAIRPVIVGGVTVFAQDGVVHGLRVAGGRPLWSWAHGQSVYGIWRWQGLVAVLTDQVSNHARLTGLDAATGAVRWTRALPGPGLLGNLAPTADGGLAMIRPDGVLQVVSLADGAVRWSRKPGASPALAASSGLVIFGVSGRLTGYDDRTGAPRWTIRGLPADPIVQAVNGLVLVTSNLQGGGAPTALTAVVPGAGRVAWRFDPREAVTVLAAGPSGLAVATYYQYRLYLLDPRTGRPRWRADTAVTQDAIPLLTSTDVIGQEGFGPVKIVDRRAADGRIRWQHTISPSEAGGQPVVRAGQLAVVQTDPARSGQPSSLLAYRLADGGRAWQAGLPAFVAVGPVVVPGGMLVQPSDLSYGCALTGSAAVGSASK